MTTQLVRLRDSKGRFLKRNDNQDKKPSMPPQTPRTMKSEEPEVLHCPGNYVKIELRNFDLLVCDLIRVISNRSIINLGELLFKSNTPYDYTVPLTQEEIAARGIPIFDYAIGRELIQRGFKLKVIIDDAIKSYSPVDGAKAIFTTYLMLMVRAKPLVQDEEKLPAFITGYLGLNKTNKEIEEMVSFNPIGQLEHHWIKSINVNSLPEPVQNKIRSGIAGSRCMNVFSKYPITRDIEPQLRDLVTSIITVVESGPYFEQHPFFTSEVFKGLSLSKNLSNLILDVYTQEEIYNMVKNKSLFKYPVYDSKSTDYKKWGSSFKESFVTKVIP